MHSSINASNKKDFLVLINRKLAELKSYLLNSTHIVLTFGTAWVYRFVKSQKLVANCFKIPQKEFKKELLSVSDINSSLSNVISLIKDNNPKASIIKTVSPVRHLKDGFVDNNLSKAHLITAIHHFLSSESLLKTLFYFPSYEIMMDELRDYRFYKEDMMHPNQQAVNYIWEKFKNSSIDESCLDLMLRMDKLRSSIAHRPFNEDSTEYQNFKDGIAKEVLLVKEILPHLEL
jgi:hypothetical protein